MITRKTTPLRRSVKPAKPRKRIAARRAKPRRGGVLRDRGYLDWLQDQKCLACRGHRNPGAWYLIIDPAHGPSAGARVKGPDNEAIPLCRVHHSEQHNEGWPEFERLYKIDREKEARTHYVAYLIVSGKLPPAEGLIK